MALVAPNPEYDKFNADWQKSHPFTLPSWDAPYIRPALDTDVSNGITFGDWRTQLSDYVNSEQSAWMNRIMPPGAPPMVMPPASIAPPQPNPALPQKKLWGDENQIPMPGQLGAMAKKSALAQGPLSISDNWQSLFNQG